MNILFLFVSLPHLQNNNSIFASLIKEFRKNGHNVFVSTKGLDTKKTRIVIEDDIPVLRIKSHQFTGVSNSVKKALAYQEYTIKQAYYTYNVFRNEKIDLIISHSLPPELAFTVGYLKRKFQCRFFLIQTDFIWQDAVAFNYFSKKSIIAKYYQYWESKLFKTADFIACPTNGNITFITREHPNIPSSRFVLLPFWQQPIDLDTKSSFIKESFGLKNKFVVVYGGSIGKAQRVERIIELAESCKDIHDIAFVILGKGAYLEDIKILTKEKQLTNVLFRDFMPQNEYLSFLSSCDVGLIILNEKMATPNFPSKSLSYLNMKVPILAALDYCTDFGDYLEENGAGLWTYSDNITSLTNKLLMYYNSPELRQSIKEAGYNLFMEKLTPKQAYQNIIKVCNND